MTLLDAPTVWVDVCAQKELIPNRGVCALVGPYQVALFLMSDADTVYAISNYDPFSRAYLLSRGIVGSTGDCPKVASPVYKQSFDLRTGVCLDDPAVSVATFATRVIGGRVEVELP